MLRVGNPADDDVAYGPLIDEAARDKVHTMVHDSVAAGARLVTGGSYDDLFYRPTVLADVPVEARAYQEEIFGPIAPSSGSRTSMRRHGLPTETECWPLTRHPDDRRHERPGVGGACALSAWCTSTIRPRQMSR